MTLTRPSPNHSGRRGSEVSLIVLHCDASANERGTISWIQSAESKVSYHALVRRDGTVETFVPYDRMAWHAGPSKYNGRKHCNLYSIGLAFANRNNGREALTQEQIVSMQELVADIRRRYGPLPVATHAEIAVPRGRKADPDGLVKIETPDGPKMVQAVPNFRIEDYA